MTKQEALYKYNLRLGDNALILSQRLSEWCSNAPFIEEDLALTNFALDMIGRAQAFLKYAGEVEGKGKTEDVLAFRRSERQYYNNQIAEVPNGDFACTMVRQLFISAFEMYLFAELQNSKDATIAAIVPPSKDEPFAFNIVGKKKGSTKFITKLYRKIEGKDVEIASFAGISIVVN